MSSGKALHDAGKKAAKEQFKIWIAERVSDPAAFNFMLDQFDAAYDLILEAVKTGGAPTKGDIIRFFGSKAVGFSALSEENRVACVSSIVSFGLTASTAPGAGAGGPAAWAWYIGALMLDGLDVGGNCYLAYQDHQIGRQLKDFEKQIQAKRMWGYSNAKCAIEENGSVDSALVDILNWRQQQPQTYNSAGSSAGLR